MAIELIERNDVRLLSDEWRTKKFRELLKASGLNRFQMAEFLGVSAGAIRHYASYKSELFIPADRLRLLAYDLKYGRGEDLL